MVRGYDKHQERVEALNLLGKDLARRAGSRCELCDAAGVKLVTREVAPVPAEPDIDRCIMICEPCAEQLVKLSKPKQRNTEHWRCLSKSVWSPVPAVQVSAVRILRQLSGVEHWAEELLEHLYLEDEIEAWAGQEG